MPQIPRPGVPPLREAVAAGKSSDVDADRQLLSESAGGDSFHNVPVPNVPLPDVPLLEESPDGSDREEYPCFGVAAVAIVVAFGLVSGSCHVLLHCPNVCISGGNH